MTFNSAPVDFINCLEQKNSIKRSEKIFKFLKYAYRFSLLNHSLQF